MKLSAKENKRSGEPLYLTPYLRRGTIGLAQNISRVSLTEEMGITSHAGFFTINNQSHTNMFFWYFPPFSKCHTAPIILWVQGGAGGSSLYGLFREVGPLMVKKRHKILERKYHWALKHHLIFIDNPVGTGFSYTECPASYCTSAFCVANDLYKTLLQFFILFPSLNRNDFYIAGESYAGKFVPLLGWVIHNENKKMRYNRTINLKGMAISSPYCDPINQLDYGNYLYQHGLIDDRELNTFLKYQIRIAVALKKKHWIMANVLMDRMMEGQVTRYSLFKHYTGYNYYLNFLESEPRLDLLQFLSVLHEDDVRRSIHVGGLRFHDGEAAQVMLALDMMQSVAPLISELLSHYQFLFYNGQLDIIVAYPLTVNFLRNLKFSAASDYSRARRRVWKVDNEVAGYVKLAGNLTEALVRNAGHLVSQDQPKWTLDLITRFINNDYKF
ncbi:unnamed protein product [Chrysodeixis includens]|uniref:Carboxypeptidase n=1 Tax=Chrysodeixis includens TaxID=689277 RepID=A0A9N8L6N9_CHRIL|nr:unnamed protein product [Chrysodeixis includens]